MTLSSWAFFFVVTHTKFFEDDVSIFSLDIRDEQLDIFCNDFIPSAKFQASNPGITASSTIGEIPAYSSQVTGADASISVIDQCIAEQRYVRGAMARAALYLQVSISGQALVFVVRTVRHSFLSRAGTLTYVAFLVAQGLATIIAIFGFNGYDAPRDSLRDCQFCTLDNANFDDIPFFSSKEVPLYGTESVFTASVIGCTGYVIAAWIWALIWHFGLDPIKWIMMYILDEEGIRQRSIFQIIGASHFEHIGTGINLGINKQSMSRVSVSRTSVSRVSAGGIISGGMLIWCIPGVP